MSRFARMHPDDYEQRWERMIDAADAARTKAGEDAADKATTALLRAAAPSSPQTAGTEEGR